ncbi:MAG TPA: adenylyl-sulfate kinase [Beutenbergiaceae bacterium]|nr:adenylyl-sulfate kinase [Beutenbergiaceae bacterium]
MTDAPPIVLEGPKLEALELIVSGLLPGNSTYCLPSAGAGGPHLSVPPDVEVTQGGEVDLCDFENTPLARLRIEGIAQDASRTWLAGPLRKISEPEHGPARESRFTGEEDLTTSTVAVFSPGATPAEILRAVQAAEDQPLALVAEGVADRAKSAHLVTVLQDVGELLPSARVYFVPFADLGGAEKDASAAILAGLGASRFLDFRRPTSAADGGAVLLFTGLSGSGKSTIARALTDYLSANSSRVPVLLDGDHVRHELASELGFSAEDRHTNLLRQAWVGARVAEAGGIAICAPIAPFAASRSEMRAKVEPASRFFIVYVSTPLEIAEARDRKGLYKRARAGLISDFTGIDSVYEVPDDADLEIDASELSVAEATDRVAGLLLARGVLNPR